ncbi:Rieske (2Fe-2S) protein [Nonomuraea sp. NPDC050663]|uniref:Rieske (2Fe-2S) protein n=1 Tax=Nonomuraea sp. NPDC050663 TaxID=3364370 RepID=UPI0037B18C5D
MSIGGSGMPGVGRREVLGAAGAAVCGVALSGCGGNAKPNVAGIKGKVIAKTADVPVGGGALIAKWKIVITQPTAGVYKAFSAACPHKGCSVGKPKDGKMTCPCHGSQFSAETGQCLKGPADAPLTAYQVKVEGDGLILV